MPFEIQDPDIIMHFILPDQPTGLTLNSVRTALGEPLEELRDCVANNTVPTEKLLNDLSMATCNLYKFADTLQYSFEKYARQQTWDEVKAQVVVATTPSGESTSQVSQLSEEQVDSLWTSFREQIQSQIQEAQQAARQRAREAREGEAREA